MKNSDHLTETGKARGGKQGSMIAIIDYGAGNIRSVINAINRLGYQAEITSSLR